jgi:hypothetical protein
MNVTQVLEGTLSPDATTRTNAEQQLLHAAEVDFVRPADPTPLSHLILDTLVANINLLL